MRENALTENNCNVFLQKKAFIRIYIHTEILFSRFLFLSCTVSAAAILLLCQFGKLCYKTFSCDSEQLTISCSEIKISLSNYDKINLKTNILLIIFNTVNM